MSPRAHVPGALQVVWIEPSAASILRNLPATKNPMKRLSGDQKGIKASSVPACGRDVNASQPEQRASRLIGRDEDELGSIRGNRSSARAIGSSHTTVFSGFELRNPDTIPSS
jgi:hypothetical protein